MVNVFGKLKEKVKLGKDTKKLELCVAILLAAVMLIIFISSLKSSKTEEVKEPTMESSVLTYVEKTEQRLEKILSGVKGAGCVKVFVSVGSSSEFIYTKEEDIKESGEGSNKAQTSSTSIVFSKNGTTLEPILEVEVYPEIKGVLIVAEGAKDEKVRIMLLNAVSAVLNLEMSKIEVLPGERQ